ncbi:MAG TPA: hypothetical protein VKE23_03930 [Candidatus Limnocylindria bacterium]|nr:hypothetical protein [Candidatus Limnocylindria bacterium]
MVRAEGARLGLAHADAIEPHATSALADERLIVKRRRSQDHSSAGDNQRRRTEGHREALDTAAQDDREAQHGEARHRQAHDREARDREAHHGEAWWPQDHDSPQERRSLDGQARDTPQLRDTQEAPLIHARD